MRVMQLSFANSELQLSGVFRSTCTFWLPFCMI